MKSPAAALAPGVAASLDLANVEAPRRAGHWVRAVGALFPGLSVSRPTVQPVVGSIQGGSFGSGLLWTILSPPLLVSYIPRGRAGSTPMFTLMLQLEGATDAGQNGRACHLNEGDFCLIDGLAPFDLEVTGPLSRVMILKMPRHAVLSRRACLEDRTAETFCTSEPGAALLRAVLLNVSASAPYLDHEQRAAALAAVVHMLNVPRLPGETQLTDQTARRIQQTLTFIDAQLADTSLTASRIAEAQGLSRRRLDQILLEKAGTSLSAQIWIRRLLQAANDLRDPRLAARTVAQIAFGVGFEDTAHFARAFRRQFHCTPREWRQNNPTNAAQSVPRISAFPQRSR